jgi:hypothetical protein
MDAFFYPGTIEVITFNGTTTEYFKQFEAAPVNTIIYMGDAHHK